MNGHDGHSAYVIYHSIDIITSLSPRGSCCFKALKTSSIDPNVICTALDSSGCIDIYSAKGLMKIGRRLQILVGSILKQI